MSHVFFRRLAPRLLPWISNSLNIYVCWLCSFDYVLVWCQLIKNNSFRGIIDICTEKIVALPSVLYTAGSVRSSEGKPNFSACNLPVIGHSEFLSVLPYFSYSVELWGNRYRLRPFLWKEEWESIRVLIWEDNRLLIKSELFKNNRAADIISCFQ